jgi:hypothetical protein
MLFHYLFCYEYDAEMGVLVHTWWGRLVISIFSAALILGLALLSHCVISFEGITDGLAPADLATAIYNQAQGSA